jgi:hypothetical protein
VVKPSAPAATAALACLALLAASAVPARGDGVRAQYRDQKLWVRAVAAPAAQVLSAVAGETGVRFVMDSEIKPGPITIDIDGMALERAIRSLVGQVSGAAGHTMTYARGADGRPHLTQVTLYGPGKAPAEGSSVVYGSDPAPAPVPTPDLQERMRKMVEAGVPHETAEKVIDLTRDVQQLQATPAPGTYRPEDLSPASREQLQPLIERGVPMERAVQMLLLQERYKDTLGELSKIPGANAATIPSPPLGPAAPDDE